MDSGATAKKGGKGKKNGPSGQEMTERPGEFE
jgi:hypothetical protein